MRKQLLTNYKGGSMSFVVSNISCIMDNGEDTGETKVFVTGSDDPFICSESYDTFRVKLDDCLEA